MTICSFFRYDMVILNLLSSRMLRCIYRLPDTVRRSPQICLSMEAVVVNLSFYDNYLIVLVVLVASL